MMRVLGTSQISMSLAIFCSICLGGCAQINVFNDQGAIRSEWKFGVLAIDVTGSNDNTIVSASGLGLISGPSGMALGYSNARIVRLGKECRIVITAKDFEAMGKNEELMRLLKSTSQACAA